MICACTLQVIAESLSEEEIAGLKEMFKTMDTDNSGAITFDELKAGLRKYGSTLKDTEIRDLMDAVSLSYCFVNKIYLLIILLK